MLLLKREVFYSKKLRFIKTQGASGLSSNLGWETALCKIPLLAIFILSR